jgi:hypothetical protein
MIQNRVAKCIQRLLNEGRKEGRKERDWGTQFHGF